MSNCCCKVCDCKIHKSTFIYGSCLCRKCAGQLRQKSKNKCVDCGKIIERRSTRCKKCAFKGERNPFFGKHSKRKLITINYCCIDCGDLITRESALYGQGHCRHCGRNRKPIQLCVDCNKPVSNSTRKKGGFRCRYCWRKFYRGSKHHAFGKIFNIPHVIYNNKRFRSSWEANFAKWLDLSNVDWLYEFETFNLGSTTYTPDFYLPEFDTFIEIKGWWLEKSKKKFKFVQKYFNENLVCFDEKVLKMLGIV